jgi:hypothetical protein
MKQRRTYAQGFYPITDIPIEKNIYNNHFTTTMNSTKTATNDNSSSSSFSDSTDISRQQQPQQEQKKWKYNDIGLIIVSSWTEYYELRHISTTKSPVALLMTYPLTLYHVIVAYGIVPCTISYQIERRPLRIHIVGAEKELHLLDLYKELSYLLPPDFYIDLVFCIRPDMIPISFQQAYDQSSSSSKVLYSVQLTDTLHVRVVVGIYGDESSLHPNFDCGSSSSGGSSSSPPDMIMAYNAGLYAYESWRYMIEYLYHHTNVIGVCSDYNEHSAVQCASILGGIQCQNSVIVNPFRQPRAMPVCSMNLPQYSNSFLYVVNEQTM